MAVEALSVELEEEEPPSFCKNVGWGGVGLYVLALLVGGVHLYIAAEYTYYFRDMHTEHVWVFLPAVARRLVFAGATPLSCMCCL